MGAACAPLLALSLSLAYLLRATYSSGDAFDNLLNWVVEAGGEVRKGVSTPSTNPALHPVPG